MPSVGAARRLTWGFELGLDAASELETIEVEPGGGPLTENLGLYDEPTSEALLLRFKREDFEKSNSSWWCLLEELC